MVSISFYVKNIKVLVIYWERYSNKNQIMKKWRFSPKQYLILALASKQQKKEVATPIFMNSNGFYYLSSSVF